MSNQRRLPQIVVSIVLLAAVFLIVRWRSRQISEADRIKAVFSKTLVSAQNRDVDGAMKVVSSDFSAPGGLSYNSVQMMLRYVFALQYPGGIQVRLSEDSMKIDVNEREKTADVFCEVHVLGRREPNAEWEDVATANDTPYRSRFKVKMVKQADDWKVSRVALAEE